MIPEYWGSCFRCLLSDIYFYSIFWIKFQENHWFHFWYIYWLLWFLLFYFGLFYGRTLTIISLLLLSKWKIPLGWSCFFNNHPVHTSSLPWYYIPVWVCITTPIMYVILISMGLLIFIRQLIINPFKELLNEFEIFSVFVLLTAPVASVVLLNSVVYDGWRHLFFIYPLLIIMSLYGIKKLIKFIEK